MIRALDLYKSTLTIYGQQLASLKASAEEVPVNSWNPPAPTTEGAPCDDDEDEDDSEVPHKELKALEVAQANESDDDQWRVDAEVTPWPDFDNRIDSVAVLLARQAPNLSVLVSRRTGKFNSI